MPAIKLERKKNLDMNFVLLFGMPRSGTTWIGKVFDSHPGVHYMHEPDAIKRMDQFIPLFPNIDDVQQYRGAIERYLEEIASFGSVRINGKLPLFRKSGQSEVNYFAGRVNMLLRRSLDRILNKELTWTNNGNDNPRCKFVWKSIESSGRLGAILQTQPKSKGVLILRHPCGHIASVLRGQKGGAFAAGTESEEDWGYYDILLKNPEADHYGLTLAMLKKMYPEERLAWRWVLVNEKAQQDIAELKNGRIIRYEDLCQNPKEEYAKLFEFVGLSWDIQTEKFLNSSVSGDSSNYYSVFKNPISSANKWKGELDSSVVKKINAIVKQTAIGNLYFS